METFVSMPPVEEPVSIEEARLWLRMDAEVWEIESEIVESLIKTAREFCEDRCDRAFPTQHWTAKRDDLAEVKLPGGVIQEITSITYEDQDGATQTVDPGVYSVSRKGYLRLRSGKSWPSHRSEPESVDITYIVGSDPVPEVVRHAMRMLIATYDSERGAVAFTANADEIPLGVNALLWPHRMIGV